MIVAPPTALPVCASKTLTVSLPVPVWKVTLKSLSMTLSEVRTNCMSTVRQNMATAREITSLRGISVSPSASIGVIGAKSLLKRKNSGWMPWVYILMGRGGRLYVGSTSNLRGRIQSHLSGRVRSTKGWLPLKLVYAELLPTLAEARKREAQIKRMRKTKKLELVQRGVPKQALELIP